MSAEQVPTLRERLKHETRALIAETAERLFAECGFREVTIDTIAQQAGVSRQTVFNHFAVKEDLVFDRAEQFDEQIIAAIRDRPAAVSVVDAFRAQHRAFWSAMYSLPDPRPRGGFFDLVAANPTLQEYGREVNFRTARTIAHTIAASQQQDSDDMRSRVIADALVAVYAATFDAIQQHIAAAEHPRRFLDGVLQQADAALDLLERGIASYA